MTTGVSPRNVANPPLRLVFDAGTLIVEGLAEGDEPGLPGVKYDYRTKVFRAEAIWYRSLVEHIRKQGIAYTDQARAYDPVPWKLQVSKEAFPHQVEGLQAWWKEGGRGVVVLPTGTGKTHLANLAIEKAGRPALVITPTIDLMNQWYDELAMSFGTEVGLMGGGYYDIRPLTVTTYDSAYMHMERLGNKFGLIVFDECHHLPGPTYGLSATSAIAPFRLGLTATPERADNAHTHLDQLIGPIVFRREITELRGQFLAEYRVVTLYVALERGRADPVRAGSRALPGVRAASGHQHEQARRLEQVPLSRLSLARGPRGLPRLPRAAHISPGRPGKAEPAGSIARPAQRR